MEISVLISWSAAYRQRGWTVAFCPNCQGVEACRVEDVQRVTWVYLWPIQRETVATAIRCDFCERRLATALTPSSVAVDRWERAEGTAKLSQTLGLDASLAKVGDDQQRLRSLLFAVNEETHPDRIDISVGLTTGLILGIPMGAAVGHYILPPWLPQLDSLGQIFTGILAGLVLGSILGASIWLGWQWWSLPRTRLRQAFDRYPFDSRELAALARSVSRRLQSAAESLERAIARQPTRRGFARHRKGVPVAELTPLGEFPAGADDASISQALDPESVNRPWMAVCWYVGLIGIGALGFIAHLEQRKFGMAGMFAAITLLVASVGGWQLWRRWR